MISIIYMISMILSVFSWSPFVGAYLRSFDGNFLSQINVIPVGKEYKFLLVFVRHRFVVVCGGELERTHWKEDDLSRYRDATNRFCIQPNSWDDDHDVHPNVGQGHHNNVHEVIKNA